MLTILLINPIKSNANDALKISSWLVESAILENGDLSVREDITFNFSGAYNGVFREIVLENTSGIEGITVLESNQSGAIEYQRVQDADLGDRNVFIAEETNNGITLQIFSPSNDENKTFTLIYTIKNVAIKYNDIGEIYYKFLGRENDTPIDFFAVNIVLPENDVNNDVRFFAHGPLHGEINKTANDIITLEVQDVPSGTFVEARVLFPTSFIPASSNTIDEEAYSQIMEEEAQLEQGIQEDIIKREERNILFGNIAGILSIAQILVFIFFIIKYRRTKDIHEQNKYLDVPEDCSPALATYITSTAIGSKTIISTIFDLYRKGYLEIKDTEGFKSKDDASEVFIITKINSDQENLLSHEIHFIDWLIEDMGDGSAVTTKEIESYSKNNQSMFTKKYTKWIELIKEESINNGYFDEVSKKNSLPFLVIFPITLILGILALVYGNILGGVLIGTSFLILFQGLALMFRKSDYGYVEYKRWMEFKKQMKALKKSDTKKDLKKYPKDISLIYGLALGIDNSILNEFNIETDLSGDSFSYGHGWIYWYFIFNNNNTGFQKSIESSFNSATHTTGTGGGFSGGGGGGAGGGGAGGF
nr:DUF2207 domain-containing protein [Acetoanaerobium pronyense]